MPVKHLKVSAKADGPDPGNVHASDWNASHDLSGLVIADVSDSGVVGRALVKSATVAAALTALTIPNFNLMTVDATGKLTVLVGPTAALDVATKGYVDTGLAAKIGDAPSDTKLYGRKDGAWAEVTSSGGGGAYVLKAGDTMTGPLKIATGTAAAPGLAFASEAGLGWYWRTTGEITTVFGGVVTSVLQAASATATYFVLQPRTAGVSGMFARSTPLLSTDYNQVGLVQNANGTASVQTYAGGASARGNLILDAPQVLHNDGTSALPNIAFASEPGLGLIRMNAGRMAFTGGGVNAFVFNTVGTMAVNGTANNAGLYLNKPAGAYYNVLQGGAGAAQTARWVMNLGDGTAETGTNTGSNFSLSRYNDAGALTALVLRINRATGTMTFGPGTERAAVATDLTASATFDLNKAGAGAPSQLVGVNNGVLRWVMRLGDAVAESGSNVGSDFSLSRYDDAGANLGTSITIARSTGVMSLGSPVYILGVTQSASAVLRLQKLAGTNANSIEGAGSNGGSRWALQLGNGTAESGANAGSDFAIYRYADNGTFLDTAFSINRGNGNAFFNRDLAISGQTLSVNGTPSALLSLNKPAGGSTNYAYIQSTSAGIGRWQVFLGTADTESGSNAGSNFSLVAFNDAGAWLNTPMTARRSDGYTSFGGVGVNVSGYLTVGGEIQAATGMGFRWDGGNANYLRMGSGLATAWNWQYIRSTGSLYWLNGSSVSVFSIDGAGNLTQAGTSYATHLRSAGAPTGAVMNFNWSGQGGTPNWVWGGSDGVNMYVYSPSSFSVAYAANAGTVGGVGMGSLVVGDVCDACGFGNGNQYAPYLRMRSPQAAYWLIRSDATIGLATNNAANGNIYWHNQAGGAGYLGSNPISGASDERMKENIADSTVDASAQVRAMRFIEFNYKPEVRPGIDTKHHDIGFSAQNLRAIKDALVFDEPDGYMKPDQHEVLLTLAKALQETIARLDQLEKT